jgi:hypothetical protein
MRLGAAAALAAVVAASAPGLRAQELQTLTSARQVRGETAVTVHVTYAAGHFTLAPGSRGELYRMDLRYDADKFTPVRSYDAAAGVLHLGLTSIGNTSYAGHHEGKDVPSLDLTLTPDVPLTLDVDLGAAESDVELGGLALRGVHYATGASKTEVRFSRPNPLACDSLSFQAGAAEFDAVALGNSHCRIMRFEGGVGSVSLDFTGDWRADAEAHLHVAVGTLKLRLPGDLGVAISLNRFLASFDQSGFAKRGDVYYSDNYQTAPHHLTVEVESAFGGIQVEWVGAPR